LETLMQAGRSTATLHEIFPRSYEIQALESYSLLHPVEKLYQYPAQLEEGDRTGTYLRVTPRNSHPWIGFFATGFDSTEVASGIYSCPDPGSLCVLAGGYGYIVSAANPDHWMQIEQRPVVQVRAVPELKLLLFIGFTSISGLAEQNQPWTTARLSWEGISISKIDGTLLHGNGWDAINDKEVPFQVDLLTGKSSGGARPGTTPGR
jgi:hypothetical protein